MNERDSEVVLSGHVGWYVVLMPLRTKSMMRESEKHLKEVTDVLQVCCAQNTRHDAILNSCLHAYLIEALELVVKCV